MYLPPCGKFVWTATNQRTPTSPIGEWVATGLEWRTGLESTEESLSRMQVLWLSGISVVRKPASGLGSGLVAVQVHHFQRDKGSYGPLVLSSK